MATVVQNFGVSKEKMTFDTSPEDEIGYAKAFWQSVQLLPPMESRLVSKDINQRLKAAPPGYQTINKMYPQREEDPPVLKRFLQNAKSQEIQAERKKIDRLANFRAHDRQLLQKHRQERIKKEKISDHIGLRDPTPPPEMPIDDPEHFRETEVDIKTVTMQEIDKFEQQKGIQETEEDRDEA